MRGDQCCTLRRSTIGTDRNAAISLFPPRGQRESRWNPERHLEVGRFTCRADSDNEVDKAAITPSIGAADEQDSDLNDLRRGGEKQVGGSRGF